MYEKYYGFSKEPFSLNLDPRFFFLTENFKEAWNSLIYGITNRKGFILITGEEGIGKTTLIGLINLYFTINDPKIRIIPIFRPYRNLEEYIEGILRKLRFPVKRGAKSYMISQFNNFLSQGSSDGETLALVFDESQNLTNEILDDLRLLANPSPKSGRFVQEIFVGEPDIERKLESKELRPLRQRMEIHVDLKPLTKEETRQYMEYRLNKAGSTISNVFAPKAESLIFRFSQGNPMIMNKVCDQAFRFGYRQMKMKIDSASVKKAIAKLEKEISEEARLGRRTSSRRRKYLKSGSFFKRFFFPSVAIACLGWALFLGRMNWEIPSPLGKKYLLDRAISHFKAIWPWADERFIPPPRVRRVESQWCNREIRFRPSQNNFMAPII